jgi:hypothetical protein
MEVESLQLEARRTLLQLVDTVNQLSHDEYITKIGILSNRTIGEHIRHIIELFQQLVSGYNEGIVDYDKRERNIAIQQNIDYAVECIGTIICKLERPDKPLYLSSLYNNDEKMTESNYFRELIYNIEHCIHHQAIIKIALLSINKNVTDDDFGVAKSTLIFRNRCAQ